LRQIRGFPVPVQGPDGKQAVFLGLADARQISDRPPVVVSPAVKEVLPFFTGEFGLDQIVEKVGRGLTRDQLEPLVAQLDDAGLLEGPVFDGILAKMKQDFDSSSILPPGSTAAFADMLVEQALGAEQGAGQGQESGENTGSDAQAPQVTQAQKDELGPGKLAEALDAWIDAALKDEDSPAFDRLPAAIVAPHIDYPRGWINYAKVWGRMRVVDRPDRVVILGTNHFGMGTGVVGCDKGFASPFGECPVDQDIVEGLRHRLGEALYADRYDHEREHSIELQIAWLQHCLGKGEDGSFCPVFGALVHDPTVNNGESYDGQGVSLNAFCAALKEVLAELPGRTLVVSSADLSHVGPMFGDQQPLAGESPEAVAFRDQVLNTDRELLAQVQAGKMDDLIATMAWQGNATRWCSVGNIAATLKVVEPTQITMLNYAAAMDPQGAGMVSNAALVMYV